MKRRLLALAGALFVSFCFLDVHAAGIYQIDYRYSFDGMADDTGRAHTFVICEDACVTGPYLARAARVPGLAVRVTRDVTHEKSAQDTPPSGVVDSLVKDDKTDRPRNLDPRITLLFDLDSSTLKEPERSRLSSFLEKLSSEAKAREISVTGYTCDLGSKRHNDVLARQRAEAVAAWLRQAGVHPSEVTARGKCCYATEDPHKRYLNRRVEVITGKKEVTQ